MSCVVAPFDQLYVYPGVPPPTVKSIDPFAPPKHETFTCVCEEVIAVGCVNVTLLVLTQPFASVIVAV